MSPCAPCPNPAAAREKSRAARATARGAACQAARSGFGGHAAGRVEASTQPGAHTLEAFVPLQAHVCSFATAVPAAAAAATSAGTAAAAAAATAATGTGTVLHTSPLSGGANRCGAWRSSAKCAK